MLDELLVFVLGLVIGSFLNACIHRIPRGISIVTPRSSCPECGHQIGWKENIPLLSFILQGGKCRGCGTRISWIYPLVEGGTAIGFLLLYLKFGLAPPFFVNLLLFSLLIVLAVIDLYNRILPDKLTFSGLIVGFAVSPLQSAEFLLSRGSFHLSDPVFSSFLNSFLGIVFGGGFLWLVAVLYLKLRKMEGLGFGDVKMMGMVGAFLGWQFTWLTILLGSLLGALIGGSFIYLSKRDRLYELPFGTFLAFAAIFVILAGPQVLDWYVTNVLSS